MCLMDEWDQKKPTAYTCLDDFLPCVDKDVAQGMLNDTKMANYAAIGVVNQIVYMTNSDSNSGDSGSHCVSINLVLYYHKSAIPTTKIYLIGLVLLVKWKCKSTQGFKEAEQLKDDKVNQVNTCWWRC